MIKRWCEYQKRSKCLRLLFSMANQTMTASAMVMIHPVTPCVTFNCKMQRVQHNEWMSRVSFC